MSGKSAYAVAKSLGHAPNWLYRVINGEAGILLPKLREVAAELGVSVGSLVDTPDARNSSGPDFVYIEEVEAVPGSGMFKFDETFKRRVALPRVLLEGTNYETGVCQLVRIKGDAMAPILLDGCLVMIDRLSRKLQDGSIYVMETEVGLLVRRIHNDPDLGWMIMRGEVGPIEYDNVEQFHIIGEVRRAWLEF